MIGGGGCRTVLVVTGSVPFTSPHSHLPPSSPPSWLVSRSHQAMFLENEAAQECEASLSLSLSLWLDRPTAIYSEVFRLLLSLCSKPQDVSGQPIISRHLRDSGLRLRVLSGGAYWWAGVWQEKSFLSALAVLDTLVLVWRRRHWSGSSSNSTFQKNKKLFPSFFFSVWKHGQTKLDSNVWLGKFVSFLFVSQLMEPWRGKCYFLGGCCDFCLYVRLSVVLAAVSLSVELDFKSLTSRVGSQIVVCPCLVNIHTCVYVCACTFSRGKIARTLIPKVFF